jgi:hypothetical protein
MQSRNQELESFAWLRINKSLKTSAISYDSSQTAKTLLAECGHFRTASLLTRADGASLRCASYTSDIAILFAINGK